MRSIASLLLIVGALIAASSASASPQAVRPVTLTIYVGKHGVAGGPKKFTVHAGTRTSSSSSTARSARTSTCTATTSRSRCAARPCRSGCRSWRRSSGVFEIELHLTESRGLRIALLTVEMTWLLAHGIGGIRDLPVPRYVFFYGAAGVLVVSFAGARVALARPVLAERRDGRPLPPACSACCSPPRSASSSGRSRSRCSSSSGSARSSARTTAASTSRRPSSTSSSGSRCRSSRPARQRLVGADPVEGGGGRRRLGWRSGAGRRAVRVPGAARPLARRRDAPLVRGDGADLPESVRPARARARDRDLQRGHLGRSGRVRLGGVVPERRRLLGRLHAALADQRRSRGATRTGSSSSGRRSPACRSATRRRGRSRWSR